MTTQRMPIHFGVAEVAGLTDKRKKIKAVEIRAEIRQLKSMADGTVNLVLNLPEDCREQTKVLLDWLGLEVRAVVSL